MTDSIEARLDVEFAPAWRPDPGEKLAGEVVAIGERAGEYDPYVIVTVRRDDGEEFAIHAFHTVLGRELAALRPKLGDKLAVKYVGKKPNRGGTGHYHAYKALKDDDDGTAAVNWDRYAGDTAEEPVTSDLPAFTPDTAVPATAVPATGDEPIPF